MGSSTNNSFNSRAGRRNTTYFWRVDEIAGANTNTGAIWSFTTVPGSGARASLQLQ